ncbi:MAG TPA: PKD domain-containing protein, partial [Gaiellaceae bacterium]|nr:PKD domain-containing protein [Gaiellaceae bacterium]
MRATRCAIAVFALALLAVSGASTSDAAVATTIHPTEGASFSGLVDSFACPPGTPTPSSVSINWGDSTSPSAGTATVTSGTCQISGTHTYAEEGTDTTTITYMLASGGQSSDVGSAIVADAPLSASDGIAVSASAGQAFTATVATFTDPAPEPPASYSANINWGDGQTSAGSIAGGFSVSGGHTYANGGTYSVTVSIHDDGGAAATQHDSATVSGCTTVAPSTPSPPFQPPAIDLNTRYVQALYHDLLARTPSQGEVGVATSALAHGLARAQLVQQLVGSSEYRGDLATSAYKRLLGAAPDPATKQFLVGLLTSGGSDE